MPKAGEEHTRGPGRPKKKRSRAKKVTAKKTKADVNVKELARSCTEDAIQALMDIITDPDGPTGPRVQAAKTILDRAYGKASQEEEAAPVATKQTVKVRPMTPEEIEQIRKQQEEKGEGDSDE